MLEELRKKLEEAKARDEKSGKSEKPKPNPELEDTISRMLRNQQSENSKPEDDSVH